MTSLPKNISLTHTSTSTVLVAQLFNKDNVRYRKSTFFAIKKVTLINKSNRREKQTSHIIYILFFCCCKDDLRRDAHVACVEVGGSFVNCDHIPSTQPPAYFFIGFYSKANSIHSTLMKTFRCHISVCL